MEKRELITQLFKEFCKIQREEHDCKCYACPLLEFLWSVKKCLRTGATMKRATKEFERKKVPARERRKIMEDTLGMSLDVVQTLIKEVEGK